MLLMYQLYHLALHISGKWFIVYNYLIVHINNGVICIISDETNLYMGSLLSL